MKRETRYDYAAAVAARYQRSSREQKGWILDEFCAATGYNRKYAIKLLCGPLPRVALPVGHGRPPVYGPAEAAVLRTCWEIADHVCSKRLAPFLPELLGRLRACGELSELSRELVDRVANMSAATLTGCLVRTEHCPVVEVDPRLARARCYATRCRSRPSPTGMVRGLAFWKSTWWPIAGPQPLDSSCSR